MYIRMYTYVVVDKLSISSIISTGYLNALTRRSSFTTVSYVRMYTYVVVDKLSISNINSTGYLNILTHRSFFTTVPLCT